MGIVLDIDNIWIGINVYGVVLIYAEGRNDFADETNLNQCEKMNGVFVLHTTFLLYRSFELVRDFLSFHILSQIHVFFDCI